MYEALEIFFTNMVQDSIDCGGRTHELIYLSGPLGSGFDLTSDYSVADIGGDR